MFSSLSLLFKIRKSKVKEELEKERIDKLISRISQSETGKKILSESGVSRYDIKFDANKLKYPKAASYEPDNSESQWNSPSGTKLPATIYLDENTKDEQLIVDLAHELTHAAQHSRGSLSDHKIISVEKELLLNRCLEVDAEVTAQRIAAELKINGGRDWSKPYEQNLNLDAADQEATQIFLCSPGVLETYDQGFLDEYNAILNTNIKSYSKKLQKGKDDPNYTKEQQELVNKIENRVDRALLHEGIDSVVEKYESEKNKSNNPQKNSKNRTKKISKSKNRLNNSKRGIIYIQKVQGSNSLKRGLLKKAAKMSAQGKSHASIRNTLIRAGIPPDRAGRVANKFIRKFGQGRQQTQRQGTKPASKFQKKGSPVNSRPSPKPTPKPKR